MFINELIFRKHNADIGHYGQTLIIQTRVVVDVILGESVELKPGCVILGHTTIGDYSPIGANAAILSWLKLGCNVKVAAGSVLDISADDDFIFSQTTNRII